MAGMAGMAGLMLRTISASAAGSNPWGLPELLHIDWRRIGDLPIGVEDNSGAFLNDDTLLSGFGLGCETTGCFVAASNCSSHDEACWSRPGALLDVANAPPGHHYAWFSRMYVANVSGARTSQQWSELPLPPLSPRQGTCGAVSHRWHLSSRCCITPSHKWGVQRRSCQCRPGLC